MLTLIDKVDCHNLNGFLIIQSLLPSSLMIVVGFIFMNSKSKLAKNLGFLAYLLGHIAAIKPFLTAFLYLNCSFNEVPNVSEMNLWANVFLGVFSVISLVALLFMFKEATEKQQRNKTKE